jgi:hypothetical protein
MSNWICCTNRDGGTVWLNMDLAVAVRSPNPASRTKSRTTGVFFAGEGPGKSTKRLCGTRAAIGL